MPFSVDSLFDSEDKSKGGVGSQAWSKEIFHRAFGGRKGPFDKVYHRLSLGFSVLVYLPGNCMHAAAEMVKEKVFGRDDWSEFGAQPEGKEAVTIDELWKESVSMFKKVADWFFANQGGQPNAIFHNLDLLSDGKGNVYPGIEAQTALFSLITCTRSGVVLGLSDRDAGELPEAIQRPFAEQVTLDSISFDNFANIIPVRLGEKLAIKGEIPDNYVWLLASRLRWIDPIRAVKIMDYAASTQTDIGGILKAILGATRTVEFLDPEEIAPGHASLHSGYEREVIHLLEKKVIAPFRRWASFTGSKEACERQLRKLTPGLILYGPPGTGKTSLARSVAKAIDIPVRQVSAADLKQPDYGLTEKLVRKLFREARRAAPCVIVLDDADDLLPDRETVQGSVASAERGIVNAFLQELQGFSGQIEGVLVIMTTNRFDQLDKAARARLPIHIRVPYPLDENQVGEIVDSIARPFGFELLPEIRAAMIKRFMARTVSSNQTMPTQEERRGADKNLFSPREIEAAMRHLENPEANPDVPYCPGPEDLKQMEEYLDRMAEQQGAWQRPSES